MITFFLPSKISISNHLSQSLTDFVSFSNRLVSISNRGVSFSNRFVSISNRIYIIHILYTIYYT